jgi:hypothetical protein
MGQRRKCPMTLSRTLCIVMSDDFEFGSDIMYCDVWWLWVWVGYYVLWRPMTLSLSRILCIVMSDDFESDIMYCDVRWLWVWVGYYVLWCLMTLSLNRTLCIVMSDDFELGSDMYCCIVMSDDLEFGSDITYCHYCDAWWLWVWVAHYVLWDPMDIRWLWVQFGLEISMNADTN